eukprot:COSAG01_NODE_2218_length_8146_cov_7.810015_10_plen_206_part_00
MEANLRKISLMLYAANLSGVKLPVKAAFKQVGQYHDRNEVCKELRCRKKLAGIVGEWQKTGAVTARGVSPERGGSRSPSPVIPDAKMVERLETRRPFKVVIPVPVHTESVPGNGDLAASLAMAEARIHDLVNERRRLNYAAKKVVNEVDALEKAGAATRKIIVTHHQRMRVSCSCTPPHRPRCQRCAPSPMYGASRAVPSLALGC